jgi:hypothetical protein
MYKINFFMPKIDVQKLIDEHQPKDIEALNQLLNAAMHRINDAPLPDFCGLSPNQMTKLLYAPFSEGSPFGYKNFDPAVLDQSPFFLLAEDILRRTVLKTNPFKMTTSTHALPVSVVKELYENLTLKDEEIEDGFIKLSKESDCSIIHVCRIVLDSTCVVRKQHGKWHLTKKGEKLVQPAQRNALFQEIFQTFALTYNWGYLDWYEHPNTGQMGFTFFLSLLSKFGETVRSADFYVQKYGNAFPMLLDQIPATSFSSPEQSLTSCFDLRFIERFAHWWGLVEILQKRDIFKETPNLIRKTGLLDLLFQMPTMKDMG